MLMVGGVNKRRMFDNKLAMIPDLRTVRFYYRKITSREDHTLLGAMADEFEGEGIPVRSVIDYCPELLVRRGSLTRAQPTRRQWADIRFGWPLIKKIAALQIGQTIVVKHLAVLAVEGIDGTDKTLERGGALGRGGPLRRGGAVAVKVAKERHDVRFDIPCIGTNTVDTLQRAGIGCWPSRPAAPYCWTPRVCARRRRRPASASWPSRKRTCPERRREGHQRQRQGHAAGIRGEPRPAADARPRQGVALQHRAATCCRTRGRSTSSAAAGRSGWRPSAGARRAASSWRATRSWRAC